jgi:Lrp/AsnC family transcriptional regulator, leucine-responsive regulatory protein
MKSVGGHFIDALDRKILNGLVENSRISFRDLARIANLSPNATAERVYRLQKTGVIRGFRTEINRKALGLPLQAYIDVKLQPGISMEVFESALSKMKRSIVREAFSMTGAFDARIFVNCEGPEELGKLIEDLRIQTGVQETSSTLIFRELQLGRERH